MRFYQESHITTNQVILKTNYILQQSLPSIHFPSLQQDEQLPSLHFVHVAHLEDFSQLPFLQQSAVILS